MRALGRFLWRFMVIFSFIVNIVLVVVLLVAGLLIFEIKNQVAQPLVEGLHSSFVGLDQATIDWTIPVRDQIQVKLDIPLNTITTVVLQEAVPLQVVARIDLPGINAYNVAANVSLELPVGLELPVALNLDVAVDQPLDIELDVRAVIPLSETQLHDVADNLRLQLEPLAIALNNLPNGFGGALDFVGEVLRGEANLLAENDYSRQPWRGYSITAGVGYDFYGVPVPENNIAIRTGIVTVGGMPALDEQIRPDVWGQGGPLAVIERAEQNMAMMGISPIYWRDGLGALMRQQSANAPVQGTPDGTAIDGGDSEMGILPPPQAPEEETPSEEDQGIFSSGG